MCPPHVYFEIENGVQTFLNTNTILSKSKGVERFCDEVEGGLLSALGFLWSSSARSIPLGRH